VSKDLKACLNLNTIGVIALMKMREQSV